MPANFKKDLLNIAVCSALYGGCVLSNVAIAQDQEDEKKFEEEEVIVYGMRSSLQSSQDIKRMADTVKDVITASDIGALPDKSVTEALQRVPGVTIERFASSTDPNHFAAEGRGVIVRGLDRVRSEFNGRDSFSANTSGGLNFEDVPPELLGSVEVVKNQTSDMIAGGISGTVNLITRKPFDSPDRLMAATGKINYGDMAEDAAGSLSGLFSDRWEVSGGEIGFLISVSANEIKSHGDGTNVENFYERSATQTEFPSYGSTALTATNLPDDIDSFFVPHGATINSADSERERTGFTTSLQWQNTNETIKATAEFIRSDSSETWREHVVTSGVQGFNAPVNTMQLLDVDPSTDGVQTDATFDSDGMFTSGSLSFGDPYLATSRSHQVDNVIEDSSLHLTMYPSERWSINLDYQHIDATATVRNNTLSNSFRYSDLFLDLRGSDPQLRFLEDPATLADSDEGRSSNFQSSIMDTHIDAEGKLDSFAADVEFNIDSGWFRTVSGGIYFSEREQNIKDDAYANWGAVSATWAGTGLQSALIDHPELYESFTFDSDFYDGDVVSGDNRTFLFPRMENTFDVPAYDAYLIAQGISNAARVNRSNRDITGDGVPDTDSQGYLPYEINDTTEQRQEAYIRLDLESESANPISANIGIRYVRYDVEATGASRFNEIVPPENTDLYPLYAANYPEYAAFLDGTGTIPETYDAEPFSTFLPSANINISLSDEVLLRLAASKALYFPQMTDIRNRGTYLGSGTDVWLYDDLSRTTASWACDTWTDPDNPRCNEPVDYIGASVVGFRSNPDLEPEKATQYDATIEWYFAEVGSLTFAAFHKKVYDLFREKNITETVVNPNSGLELDMVVRLPVNEGEGEINGFEIAYQQFYDFLPGAFSGLGLQLNYTYIDQKDLSDGRGDIGAPNDLSPDGDNRNTFRNFTGLGLPGLSEETFNIVGMYQYAGIEARIAYNWRSEYLLARRDANSFSAIYADPTGFMDASIWYAFNDNIKVGLEGSNLTSEVVSTQTQLNQQGVKTPKSQFIQDTRYALSIRATF